MPCSHTHTQKCSESISVWISCLSIFSLSSFFFLFPLPPPSVPFSLSLSLSLFVPPFLPFSLSLSHSSLEGCQSWETGIEGKTKLRSEYPKQPYLLQTGPSYALGASVKEPACQWRRHKRPGFNPWVGNIPWRRQWQPTSVFSSGESPGQRSLAGYSP